jgi:hypothetical protein
LAQGVTVELQPLQGNNRGRRDDAASLYIMYGFSGGHSNHPDVFFLMVQTVYPPGLRGIDLPAK